MTLEIAVGGPADSVAAWARAERRYRDATWTSRAPEIHGMRFGATRVLLTAPHAGQQTRNAWPKPADSGTGGLTETVARLTGCSAVTVSGVQHDDPNWDESLGAFKREALGRLPDHPVSLDIHAMRTERHVDICIGTGSAPDMATVALAWRIAQTAREAGFLVAVNQPFPAARAGTMTSFVQASGYRGVQIELNARFLDPEGKPAAAQRIIDWLTDVVREAERLA